MAGFDELIFNCLARDMDFRGTLAELYKSAGVWSALFDPSQHNSICVPEEGEERLEELERLRRGILDGFLTGDEKTAALLHGGESVIFEPGVSGGRTHVCRVASGHSESRSIIALGLPRDMDVESGLELLGRLCQLYKFHVRSAAAEQPAREANYLEAGLARELIMGEGDISRSIFGDLYELRLDGLSKGLEPDYMLAVMRPEGSVGECRLPELGRSLAKLLPSSYRLVSEGRLYAFCCGVGSSRISSVTDKLRYFCEFNSLICGLSDSFAVLGERGGYRKQAEQALKLSLAAGRRGVTQADDVYFELIVSGAVERVGKRVLELSEIAMLADYDEKNHTEYLATLEAYLNFGNRLSPAASSMFIDRSTMKYRLQKISDLLGSDIEQPDTAKRLAIGIAVHKVSG